jgi:hypothetical protein
VFVAHVAIKERPDGSLLVASYVCGRHPSPTQYDAGKTLDESAAEYGVRPADGEG